MAWCPQAKYITWMNMQQDHMAPLGHNHLMTVILLYPHIWIYTYVYARQGVYLYIIKCLTELRMIIYRYRLHNRQFIVHNSIPDFCGTKLSLIYGQHMSSISIEVRYIIKSNN